MEFEEPWEEFLGFSFGPWRLGASFGPFRARYARTQDSHLLRLRIPSHLKREEIKVRLVEPGVLEVEFPRKARGEEIPVE